MCSDHKIDVSIPDAAAQKRVRSAVERRIEIQQNAARIGIDEDYISHLVDTFYGRIREDDILGPIFAEGVKDWSNHLPTMKRFWSSVALNTGNYSGKPVPAHLKLIHMVKPDDFARWLVIFRQTLIDTAPSQEAASYFLVRAERIAKSLQLAMFGDPDLPQLPPLKPQLGETP